MADTITTTSTLTNIVQTAHDRLLYFDLRSQPVFDAVADVKPALQAHPGDTVTWHFFSNLAANTSTLDESTDVDRRALSESTVSLTLNEYGDAVGLTAKLRATGLVDVDAGAINTVSYQLIDSLDTVARDVVVGGTNAFQSGDAGSKGAIDTSDTLSSSNVREAVAKLRGRSAVPIRDGYYVAHIHPDVSFDLREEAGSNANWREAHIYASPETIYAGEIGAYEGAIFIETPRAAIETDAGSGTTDVYKTVFLGQQYLAKAVAIDPHIVQSPVTDRLRRLPGLGWYFLGNWGRFREESGQRVESASSIGSN